MWRITNVVLAVVLWSSLLMSTPATADVEADGPPEVECEGDTRTGVINFYGRVEYAITYNRTTQRVCVVAENTGTRNESFTHVVQVDQKRVLELRGIELSPDEKFMDKENITDGIDATRDRHTVTITTPNETIRYSFVKKIDEMNESGIPTPHIEEFRVVRNDTRSGQPTIVVGFESGSMRNYSPEAVVKTRQSNLRWMRGGGAKSGRFYTRLNEAKDDIIVGTVKLYGDTYYTGTKWDRVSFVSYPNGTYETWEPEFGEIPTDREIESRQIYYENESLREKYRGPDVDPISERASKIGAIAVVTVLVLGLWYRRRRKRR